MGTPLRPKTTTILFRLKDGDIDEREDNEDSSHNKILFFV
jgi:hypothetical protein